MGSIKPIQAIENNAVYGIDVPYPAIASNDEVDHSEVVANVQPAPLQKISMEQISYQIHKIVIKTQTCRLEIEKNLLIDEQNAGKKLEQKKLVHIEEVQKAAQNIQGAQTVDKVISTAGFTISAAAMVMAGATPIGVAALVGTGLLTLDALCDHAGKKKIASWLTFNGESEKTWLGRLEIGASVATLGLGFGISGPQAVTALVQAGKTGVTGVKGWMDHKMNQHQSNVIEAEGAITSSDRRRQKLLENTESASDSVHELYRQMHARSEQQQASIRAIMGNE